MEVLRAGSLKQHRLLLGTLMPCVLLFVGATSALRSSLPWTVHVRFGALCVLGAFVFHVIDRRFPDYRFEVCDRDLVVATGMLRKQISLHAIAGPVTLTGSWLPLLSFKVGRVRHWYSLRAIDADERSALFMRISEAATDNSLQPR